MEDPHDFRIKKFRPMDFETVADLGRLIFDCFFLEILKNQVLLILEHKHKLQDELL